MPTTTDPVRDAVERVREHLPAAFGQALGLAYRPAAAPLPETFVDARIACLYRLEGAVRGRIALAFQGPDLQAAAHRFQSVAGVPGLGETEVALELTNVVVGRLLGLVSAGGTRMQLVEPGTAAPGLSWAMDDKDFSSGKGAVLACAPADGSGGAVQAWLLLEPAGPGQAAADDAPGRARVLIVDDSPLMRAFLEKIFMENGFTVAGTAADGLAAIEAYERLRPDLVTLDIIMPRLAGTEVLERILAKDPAARVIMASSVSDARTVMRCLKAGAKRYIIKPYDEKSVLAAVEKALAAS